MTYIVPPGAGPHVWEGVTASQGMKGTNYVLKGGARQIVVDPAELQKAYLSKRRATNWGYGDFGGTSSLVGVPTLKNNWYETQG